MKVAHLLALLEETGLSPEQLAKRLGISNMTVRRWMKKPPQTRMPSLYSRALEDAVFGLVREGMLTTESVVMKEIVSKNEAGSFRTVLRNLGLSKDFLWNATGSYQKRLIAGLEQIGASGVRRMQVEDKLKEVSSFRGLSTEWSSRITTLLKAVRSKKIAPVKKLVAYGALFYLIYPFDFIPDYLSVVGYLDDFSMLGLAANFLLGKISE